MRERTKERGGSSIVGGSIWLSRATARSLIRFFLRLFFNAFPVFPCFKTVLAGYYGLYCVLLKHNQRQKHVFRYSQLPTKESKETAAEIE